MTKKTVPTGERLTEFALHVITLEHLHRYAIAIELSKNKSVLDIACGEGYGSHLLALQSSSVTGVDIDTVTIEAAKIKYQHPHLNFLSGNVENISVATASFDVAVSFETLEHITDHDKMVAELKRVLKPDGVLLISTPDKLNYSDKPGYHNSFHKKELYKTEFEILLLQYFKNVQLLSQTSGLVSLITPQTTTGRSISYTGDFSDIQSEKDLGAPFLIAIASDNLLPEIPLSIFKSETLLPLLLQQQREAIKETASYKVGHILLSPFKIIRNLLRKKEQQ